MTEIKFDFRLAGEEPTLSGRLEIRPIKRLHFEDPLDFIMLPVAQIEPVVNSVASVELRPTGVDWCWVIKERFKGGITRYVVVPDSATPIQYGDLIDVNPDTLAPDAEPEAAWWIALENAIIGGGGGGGSVISVNGEVGPVVLDADDVGARPATWVPSVGEVNGLTAALAGKQPAGSYVSPTELASGLAGKQAAGDYVTAIQFSDGLATKQAAGDYATNPALTSGLAGKKDATWVPVPSDLNITTTGQRVPIASAPGAWGTSLQVTQAASASTIVQRQSTGQVTGATATVDTSLTTKLQMDTALGTKANSTHTHAISDVTNLQTTLDGKQASGNYATVSYVDAQVAGVPRFVPVATTGDAAVTAAPIGTAFLVA